ncbi:bidirectional sugar transporter SWEET17-like [Rosa rugosa]|uniref:bidirectional sugar transporter SWEET17-like n=1 Tax=Rosa rugosa TaxID=74645 RepID=UPI002B4133CC|nr:bidirectional sugar transporter SWEET17-like [Rosa rugosa]
METLSFYIGVIGNLISVLMFLAPVYTFSRIIKNRSTEEFSSLPYVCTFLNCFLWTYYGIIKPGAYLVSTINGFGILVEIIYLSLFLTYATANKRVNTAIWIGILDVGFPAAAMLVTWLALKGDVRINAIGFLSAGLNIIMYASPLAAMKTVVTTKSVEYMPFWLSFFFFLNGGVWLFYSWLEQDYFLGVPNGMGFLLGTVQLVLYCIYTKPAKKEDKSLSSALLVEEGREHEPLNSSDTTT